MRRIVFILAGTILLTAFQQQSEVIIARRRAQSGGGGGTITKVGTGTGACYPATTCALTGISVGDLILGFGGDNAVLTLSGSACSFSGSATGTNDSAHGQATAGFWCISSATSETISRATGSGADTGLDIAAFHSTSGWSGTLVQGQTTTITPTGTGTFTAAAPNITTTTASSVVFCYYLNENTQFIYGLVNQSFVQGPTEQTHSDASVYLLNAAASTYNPTITFTASGGTNLTENCMGMKTN